MLHNDKHRTVDTPQLLSTDRKIMKCKLCKRSVYEYTFYHNDKIVYDIYCEIHRNIVVVLKALILPIIILVLIIIYAISTTLKYR